jgi:hypothetical protein
MADTTDRNEAVLPIGFEEESKKRFANSLDNALS